MGYLWSLFYVVTGDSFLYIYQEMIKKFNLLWVKVIKFSNSNEKETIRGVSLKFCYFNYSATENTAISTRKKIQKKSLYLLHVIPFVHLFFWISAMKIIQAVFCLSSRSATNIFLHYLSFIEPISYHSPYNSMLSGILHQLKQNIGNH